MKIRIYPKSLLETVWQQDKLLFTPEAEQPPLCLRCGQPLDRRLVINALSRYADVHICEACGMDEALRDATVCSCTASASCIAARYSGKSMCRRLLPREMISNSCCWAISVSMSFSRSIQAFHSVCFRPSPVNPCCLSACFMDTLVDRPRVCSVATGI